LVLLFFPILFIPRSVSFGLFQLGWWKPLWIHCILPWKWLNGSSIWKPSP
jgi:hypothetical protein